MAKILFDNEKVKAVEDMVMSQLDIASSAMIDYMNSTSVIPVDTHNMKDGLGVAIYNDSELRRLVFSKRVTDPKATKPRNLGTIGGEYYGEVFGRNLIQDLLDEGIKKYSNGIWIVLLSAMPYDIFQDSVGINEGWFSVALAGEFKSLVEEVVRLFGYEN